MPPLLPAHSILELTTERVSLEDRGEHRTRRSLENKEVGRTLTFSLVLLELPVCNVGKHRWWRGQLFSMTAMVGTVVTLTGS